MPPAGRARSSVAVAVNVTVWVFTGEAGVNVKSTVGAAFTVTVPLATVESASASVT